MKKILILVLLLSLNLFARYPEVELQKVSAAEVKDQLVTIMSDQDFNIVESNDYKIDFRKEYQAGEAGIARAFLQALEGSKISSRGIEYTFLPRKGNVVVKGRPYYLQNFAYNRKPEEKVDLLNNQEAVNKVQDILDSLSEYFTKENTVQKESVGQETTKPQEIKEDAFIFVTNEQKCNQLGKSWIFSPEMNGWGCQVYPKDLN